MRAAERTVERVRHRLARCRPFHGRLPPHLPAHGREGEPLFRHTARPPVKAWALLLMVFALVTPLSACRRDACAGDISQRYGQPVDPNGLSYQATISADGRYVGLTTSDRELVPGEMGGILMVVRDQRSGSVDRVNVTSSGGPGEEPGPGARGFGGSSTALT